MIQERTNGLNPLFQKNDDELIEILARYWKMSEEDLRKPFKVIASFRNSGKKDKYGDEFGYFEDVRDLNGDILYYPYRIGKVSIFAKYRESFNSSDVWQINVRLANRSQREKFNNPFMLIMDDLIIGKPKVQFYDKLQKEKLIRKIFDETGSTDRDAKNLSNALQNLMGDLYTKTERFIFELLQNADDQPIEGSSVYVTLKSLSENLLFLHSGKPFSESDVDSISSIGDSTKKNDTEKTGYKGIGFKSVFSEAETVYINSGNFSFAFDKHSPLYPNTKNMDEVPWQIKPIWEERYRLPKEVQETPSFFNTNVAISLNVGEIKINEYNDVISQLLSQPRFILFLRNVGKLRYESKNEDVIEIKKTIQENIVQIQSPNAIEDWLIKDYVIDIPEDTQEQLQNDKLVPKKLKESTKTKITFAAKFFDGEIIPAENTVLFTYLPTEVNDYEFKFLVNADFLTTASREAIHSKNIWNRFLFKNVGELLIDWLITLTEYPGVLNLLPQKDYEGEDLLKSEFYNSFKNSISQKKFIVGNDGNLHAPVEIMIDNSGLSDIIGKEVYCKIVDSQKFLPYYNQDEEAIRKSELFDDVQCINVDIILEKLQQNQDIINWFNKATEEQKNKLFKWIKEKNSITRENLLNSFVSSLPLFMVGDNFISLNKVKESNYIILSEYVSPIKDILIKLGFVCTDNLLEDNHPLSIFIKPEDSQSVYERIKECDLSTLNSTERHSLFHIIMDIGEEQLKEISIFRNMAGEPTPLKNMVPYRDNYPSWLPPYMISSEDFIDDLIPYLIPSEKEFSELIWNNLESISSTITEIYSFYKWTDQAYTKKLISKCITNEDFESLLPIILESTSEVKKEYLSTIKKIDLSSERKYSKESFEYQILHLILDEEVSPSSYANKIYFDDRAISQFSIKDDVICEWDETNGKRKIVLSLAKILPEYADQSSAISAIKDLFEVKTGLDKFFEAKSKSNQEIYNELNKQYNLYNGEPWPLDKTDNVYQYLFCVYFMKIEKKFTSNYVKIINLEDVDDSFVQCLLDFCFKHRLCIKSAPFTYRVQKYFVNKYFDNPFLIDNEKLLQSIESWADSEEKKKYLKDNGIGDAESKSLKFRQLFLNNQEISFIEELSQDEIKSGIKYFSSLSGVSTPFTGENQIKVLSLLKEKSKLLTECWDIEKLKSNSAEWTAPEYKEWVKNHYPKIFIYQGDLPKLLQFEDFLLMRFNVHDTLYHYDKSNRCLYVSSNQKIDDILRDVVLEKKNDLTFDDFKILCLDGKTTISKEEIENKEEQLKTLSEENRKKDELLKQYRSIFGDIDSINNTSEDTYSLLNWMHSAAQEELYLQSGKVIDRDGLSVEKQIAAHKEAERAVRQELESNGYDCSNWIIDETEFDSPFKKWQSYSQIKDVINPTGEKINLVVKSAKGGYIYLSATDFEFLTSDRNNVLMVWDGNRVHSVSSEDIFNKDSNVNLIFDTEYTPKHYYAALSKVFQFVKRTTFAVKNPRYNAFETIKTFGLDSKTEGVAELFDDESL